MRNRWWGDSDGFPLILGETSVLPTGVGHSFLPSSSFPGARGRKGTDGLSCAFHSLHPGIFSSQDWKPTQAFSSTEGKGGKDRKDGVPVQQSWEVGGEFIRHLLQGSPLQYPCLGNPTDKGAWKATVHQVTKEFDTTQRLNNKQSLFVRRLNKMRKGTPVS